MPCFRASHVNHFHFEHLPATITVPAGGAIHTCVADLIQKKDFFKSELSFSIQRVIWINIRFYNNSNNFDQLYTTILVQICNILQQGQKRLLTQLLV
jgi:hypothetical protein